ncbi:hypothetical protein AAU57_02330 [Nonlabens sp. YIK11]|uniref:AlbA family DNA-binding domain-containing protein n=1 Tax=Nonlabens sp. YIK11 TaxID=1453349 RepID=UPI0006DCB252|nr:ATP-binding protein [Nonlabens sp. YIK11]KQC32291.1 hypothetical protein AAU57_02330 [Nonlabens sp. YIK11]
MNNYIEKIFHKNRQEVTLENIKNYFQSPQEETSIVEFKSGGVEIIDIYKEITAFLNTEGGLLMIGAPRETKDKVGKNYRTVCQGELTYSSFKNKDWLYQKIASNIVPTPTNIKINEYLTVEGSIFLLDIPQSSNPPHQSSSDGKYYIRLECEAKPAPHGLVQALFEKRKRPQLTAEIDINRVDFQSNEISIQIKNKSTIPADSVSVIIDIYNVSKVSSNHRFDLIEDSLGDKYSMSQSTNQVLVRVISLPYNLVVTHFKNEYLVFVAFWSKQTDFDFRFFTINPLNNEVTAEGTFMDGSDLTEELERIKKVS